MIGHRRADDADQGDVVDAEFEEVKGRQTRLIEVIGRGQRVIAAPNTSPGEGNTPDAGHGKFHVTRVRFSRGSVVFVRTHA
ncbi:MAG: hypothetical protein CM15mP74_19520 [Halieaceae bacterium]|nr:MAG: hypothetical protein CM15mP74_19520 [Halieaceae bacterium]